MIKRLFKKLDSAIVGTGKKIEKSIKESKAKEPQRRKARIAKLKYQVQKEKLESQLRRIKQRDKPKGEKSILGW